MHIMIRRMPPFALLAGLTVLLAAWVVATTVVAVVAAYSPVPYWDQWAGVTVKDHLSHLFAQHNEHRIFVPRLFFIVDAGLFAGSNLFNLASILAIQALHAALLVVLARRCGIFGGSAAIGVWVAATVVAFLFWGYQLENFSWGFQVQFVGVYAAATASFAALALRAGSRSGLVLGVLWAGVAVYSMANGVLAPVLLVVLGVWLRLPKRQVALLALAAAVLIGSFLWGYQSPGGGQSRLAQVPGHLDLFAAYALTYLGAPLGHLLSYAGEVLGFSRTALRIPAAMAFGGAGVLLFAGLGLRLLLSAGQAHPARLALLHSMMFVTGTAFVTALGRMDPGMLDQAMSERYGAAAVVFWSSAILLSLSLLPAGWLRRWGVPVALSGLVALIAAAQPLVIREGKALGQLRREATTALLAGALDTEKLARIFPEPARIAEPAQRMREARVSIFAQDWAAWRGTRLADHVRLEAPGACLGSFEAIESVPAPDQPVWRVHGWAWDPNAKGAPPRVVLTDGDGLVAGYALTGFASRVAPPTPVKVRFDRAGWNGNLMVRESTSVTAYALTDDGRAACPLAPARAIDKADIVQVAPAQQAGRAVPMETPAIEGQWAEGAFSKAAGEPPVGGTIYASWTGDDAHTGRIRWRSGPLEGARTLLVPVVTGPRGEGLALRVVDPASGRVLARLQPAGFAMWQLWQIALPQDGSVHAIEIQAEDDGQGWGQWLAVGQPHLPR